MRNLKQIKLAVIASFYAIIAVSTGCKDDGYHDFKQKDRVFNGDAYQYLESKKGVYDSLKKVVDMLGYQSILKNDSITLFAVPNESFATALKNLNTQRSKVNKSPVDLSTLQKAYSDPQEALAHLDSMLDMYIIKGHYTGDELDFQDPVPLRSVKFGLPMNARLRVSTASGLSKGGSEYLEVNLVGRDGNTGEPSLFTSNWTKDNSGAINIQTKNAVIHEFTPKHVFGFNEFVFRYSYVPPPPNLFKTLANDQYPYGGVHTASDTTAYANTGDGNSHGLSEWFERVYDGDQGSKYLHTRWTREKEKGFWIKFQPRVPSIANAYTIVTADDDPARDPKDWRLEGSLDNVNWVTIDTKFGVLFPRRQMTKVFYFPNKVAYKYYRLFILENWGNGSLMQIADWTLNYDKGR